MTQPYHLVFTCEHGGNDIPPVWEPLFMPHRDLLESHWGYDIGALDIFLGMHHHFPSSGFYATESRLLIELNRSLHHPSLFSAITKPLSKADKHTLISQIYLPYRESVVGHIKAVAGFKRCIHIGVHSFTPLWDDQVRNAEIGLLYDPKRPLEAALAKAWKSAIQAITPDTRVRFNYPYRGVADGFVTELRKKFAPSAYSGLELEVNQALITQGKLVETVTLLNQSLEAALATTEAIPQT
jgi:predicted N-formylglutamate amidohydrolase